MEDLKHVLSVFEGSSSQKKKKKRKKKRLVKVDSSSLDGSTAQKECLKNIQEHISGEINGYEYPYSCVSGKVNDVSALFFRDRERRVEWSWRNGENS